MPADPRKFLVVPCDSSKNKVVRRDKKKKDFFADSVGKIGDLEVLNKVGFGKVSEGMRELAKLSDANRIGTSIRAINEYDVLDETGINAGDVSRGAQFNPGAANRALGQAEAIAEKVNQGNFEISDIPEYFQDIQNFGDLVGGIFPGKGQNENEQPVDLCGASPYATALIDYAPKFKYMFVVQVRFNAPYTNWNDIGSTMAFVVKSSTRPSVEFEYEEVNQYNFWTRIPKRTIYPPLTMRFYDDNKNGAAGFYDRYIKSMSPIANIGGRYQDTQMSTPEWLAAHSMDNGTISWDNPNVKNRYSTASMGALMENIDRENINIINNIKLFHVYGYGSAMNVYTFHNPKVLSFTPDELDMAETGNGSEMEFQFAYDAMFMETNVSLDGGNGYDIKHLSSNGHKSLYPIDPVFSVDEKGGGTNDGQATPDSGNSNPIVAFGSAVTGAVSGVIEGGAGLVSKAFEAASDFTESIFNG